MENRISVSESLSAKHRLEYQENEKSRIQLRDEVCIMPILTFILHIFIDSSIIH